MTYDTYQEGKGDHDLTEVALQVGVDLDPLGSCLVVNLGRAEDEEHEFEDGLQDPVRLVTGLIKRVIQHSAADGAHVDRKRVEAQDGQGPFE
jgi:hypothetical protein